MKILNLFVVLSLLFSISGCKVADTFKPVGNKINSIANTVINAIKPKVTADRVLLVGINTYPGAELNGCVNDVNDMHDFLIEYYNFHDDEIRIITDNNATTKNIKEGLEWLVADAKPGNRRVFHYSGHGAEYAGPFSADQPGKVNQVICPVDFDWNPERMIMDVDFVYYFSKIPPGVLFNWISDSCHSGDLDRDFKLGVKYRSYPIIPPIITFRVKSIKRDISILLNVGFISGCKYNEVSADAIFNDRWNGALTFCLIRRLKQDIDKSLNDVVKDVVVDVKDFEQTPQVSGARADRPFLK